MTPHYDIPDENAAENPTSPAAPRRVPLLADNTEEHSPNREETLVNKPSTTDLEVPPDLKPATRYGEPFLGRTAELKLVLRGYTTQTVTIEIHDTFIIGRTSSSGQEQPDLDLNDLGGYISGVSRQHVMLTKDANILTVTDLDSRNGTYLNGVKLNPHQPRMLRDGDELCLGTLFLSVHFRESALDAPNDPGDYH